MAWLFSRKIQIGGYIGYAKQSGAVYYHNHQGVWETLGELGKEQQAQIAWLINQKALQSYIERGVPFEYALKGLSVGEVEVENQVMEMIWKGESETDILNFLRGKYDVQKFSARWRELAELYRAGYQKTFDETINAYILIKP